MTDLIQKCIDSGAAIYSSVSGGKDGQAMTRTLVQRDIPIAGMIHCDLGRSEWPQSLSMCKKQAVAYSLPLHILKRKDGLDLLGYMQRRMKLLQGTGKPFWPSSAARYCTSDLKRAPCDAFFRSCGSNLIISAEGIRAQESPARAKKEPLSIRQGVTSKFYKGMSVEEAIATYNPIKRLVLNWYPIFNMSLSEVWATYGVDSEMLATAYSQYNTNNFVPSWWPFHQAYAMGNDRVSCVLCILGSLNDLKNGAKQAPDLLHEMIDMETESGATFKQNFSLKSLL